MAVTALSATPTLPACSGDSSGGPLSKREFITNADEICAGANKRIGAIGAPDLTDPDATSRAIRRLVTIQRQELDDLRGLEPPGTDQPAINKWLVLTAKALREAESALAALERGDRSGVNEANARGGEAQREADDLAETYGVNRCVSGRGEPSPTTAT